MDVTPKIMIHKLLKYKIGELTVKMAVQPQYSNIMLPLIWLVVNNIKEMITDGMYSNNRNILFFKSLFLCVTIKTMFKRSGVIMGHKKVAFNHK